MVFLNEYYLFIVIFCFFCIDIFVKFFRNFYFDLNVYIVISDKNFVFVESIVIYFLLKKKEIIKK